MSKARIAVLQMCSGIDADANFSTIEQAAQKCAGQADVLFTPEMSILLDRNRRRAAAWIESDASARMCERIFQLCQQCNLEIAIGSMPVRASAGRWANRSMYFDPASPNPISYDKIHMFDVELANGETWRESSAYEAGKDIVVVDGSRVGRLGLAVCYDMRFPALFDALGHRQCDTIAVPAAFTRPTGAAHWHVLLRARAIEASAFVIAAAQVGKHEDGRETYGHSLVVDPWGDVLLDMGGEEPGLAFCDLDMERIADIRSQVPSLANRRDIPR